MAAQKTIVEQEQLARVVLADERDRIKDQIEELRRRDKLIEGALAALRFNGAIAARVADTHVKPTTTEVEHPKRKYRLSAATRRRMSLAQKARYAANDKG